jgi:hypothetical protein
MTRKEQNEYRKTLAPMTDAELNQEFLRVRNDRDLRDCLQKYWDKTYNERR